MANNIKLPEITGNVNDLNDAFEKLTTTIGDSLKQAGKLNTQLSSVKKLTDLTKTQLDLEKKAVQIDKEKKNLAITSEKLVNEKIKGQQESIKLNKEEARLKEQQIKTEKQALDLKIKEKKENERLNKQKIQQNKHTKESIKQKLLEKEAIRKTTEEAKKELGLTKKRSSLFKSMTKSILAAGAAFLSFQAASRVFLNSIKTIASFEEAMDKVAAVTGALPADFKALTENAKLLGQSTSRSATQVAGLQLEFSKLGFSTKEILAATEATIQLSIAAGEDLANSAVVAASTVRGFGLNADETQRVVDVMAKSFASSALDLEKFKTAMATVAPVAKASGKDIEFTTAQISILADAGLDASTAGTSLRNMFLELNKQGLTWEEGLEKINNSTNKNVTALDLFGKRGATAALILADNTQKAEMLEKSYDKAAGTAKKMSEVMEDNLIGDTKKLSSAWEGWILSSSEGITQLSRKIVQLATKVLTKLNKSTEKQIDLRKIDTREMNASFNALKDVNISQDARLKLIDKINTQYGEYLPNLLDENSTIKEITAAQKEANKAYRVKIIQQAFQKEINELLEKELEAQESIVQSQIDRAEANDLLVTSTNEAEKAALDQTKLVADLNESLGKSIVENNEAEIEAVREKFKRIAALYNIAFDEIEKIISDSENKIVENTETTIGKVRDKLNEEGIDRLTEVENLYKRETVALSDEFLKRLELNKQYLEQLEADEELSAQRREEIRNKLVETTAQLGNTLFELAQNQRETELSQIQADYDARIQAAEGDAELQKRLALELENEQKRIAREQAVSKQNQALFDIGVDTAKNIVSVFPNIALMTLAGVVGAAQAAIVKSQPLPGFFTGTESAPAGLAYVAEKGRELIERNGQMFMADKPQIFDFKGGETVYNNAETERMINGAIYRDIAVNGNQGVEERIDKLTRAVMNKKENHFSWNERGFGNYVRSGSGITRYMQKKGRR